MNIFRTTGLIYTVLGVVAAYSIYPYLFLAVASLFGGHAGKINYWPYLSMALVPLLFILIGILLFINRHLIKLLGITVSTLLGGMLVYLLLVASSIQNNPGQHGKNATMSIYYGLMGHEIIVTKELLVSVIIFLFIVTLIAIFSFLKLPDNSIYSDSLTRAGK